ncbi:MAG TPA: pyridoxal phosphate-dependent aminotransferase [Thermoanaerobaculia bacterium]|nr:pyridoxal phosphate-dependent aminotransferase [Thermoanaerobaculia bacterium]
MTTLTRPKIRFASRVTGIQTSPTLVMLNRAREMQARGIDVIDFAPGEPDFDTPPSVAAAGKRAIDQGHTRYTNALGTAELRAAIARKYNECYGTSIRIANVIAGTGGKQELFNLMLALVSPGDEVIVPAPYWVSFPDQILFAGGIPRFAPARPENRLRTQLRDIEPLVSPRTRGLILNSPSNPSGAVIDRVDLEDIIRFCHDRQMFLVFDETYERFLYDGAEHTSAAAWFDDFPETIIAVNSMSKTYAMTGWRLGYAVAHEEVIEAIGRIQSHSTSNPSSISQFAAVEALASAGDEVRAMIDAYAERRKWLVPALNAIPGLDCDWPDGAFYVFPSVRGLYGVGGIDDSTSLSEYLLEQAHVAVVPGAAFGADDHIRISYATSLERLQEGVARIQVAVQKLL